MRALATALPLALLFVSGAARADDAVAQLGKQHAIDSRLDWEIREARHPVLGPVRFAHTLAPVVTAVGARKIYSNAYVSCEESARTIAIELTNQVAPADPGGLRPKTMPRLVCLGLATGGKAGTVRDDLEARWQVNDLGDALARGLRPWALRACAAIEVVEDVALPSGWGRPSAPVRFEITPYARELDSIFATCGEKSAYEPGPAPARPAPAAAAPDNWKTVRTVANGRTNVRAKPDLGSKVVVQLAPGAEIFAQSTGGAWWRVKSRYGWKWEGYVREDRLVVK